MKIKLFLAGVFCLLLIISCGSSFDQSNWLNRRGPNGNGISLETKFDLANIKFEEVWNINVGEGFSSVAIKENRLYTLGYDKNNKEDIVYCINTNNGDVIWSYNYYCTLFEHIGPSVTPTIENDCLYTISRDGDVFCFNTKDGKVIWNKKLVEDFGASKPLRGFNGSLVIENNFLIINAFESGIALNKHDGSIIWQSRDELCGSSTPVIFDFKSKKYAALFTLSKLKIVELETGELLWEYPWRTRFTENLADPIVFDDKIFLSSAHNRGCALLQITEDKPVEIWKNKNINSHFSTGIYIEGYIYASSGNSGRPKNKLVCLNAKTGEIEWEERYWMSSLTSANNKLIVLEETGNLHIVEAVSSDYKEYSMGKVIKAQCWTDPVYCGGKIYLRNTNGHLVCIK